MAIKKDYFYKNNDDVVVAIAQCGDYIREHAEDLIGRVISEKHDISTVKIEITLKMEPGTVPKIIVSKDTAIPIFLPFEEVEDGRSDE